MKFKRMLSFILIVATMLTIFVIPTSATEVETLTNNSTISETNILINDSITLNAEGSGGTAPYTYAYYYKSTSASTWHTIKGFSSADSTSLTLSTADDYNICIKVKDADSTIAKKYFVVTASNGALSSKSYLSSTNIDLGNTVTLNGVGIGGSPAYTYAYYYKLENSSTWICRKTFSSSNKVVLTPTSSGTYDICIKTKDTTNTVHKIYFKLYVTLNPIVNNSTVNKTNFLVNEPVIITGDGSGGYKPYQYSYYYKNINDANWTTIKSNSDLDWVKINLSTTGSYQAKVVIQDAQQQMVEKTMSFTVSSGTLDNLSSIDTTAVVVGGSVNFQAIGMGGTAPYQYSFLHKTKEATTWTTDHMFSSINRMNITFGEEGTYDACIKVRDSNNVVSKRYFEIEVTDDIGICNTVYFHKPSNWQTPYIYYTDADNPTNWYQMDMTNNNTDVFEVDAVNWYECDLTAYENSRIIITDGTNAIATANGQNLIVSETMWYQNGYWDNGEQDSDDDGLSDVIELSIGTNLNSDDTDNDGFSDCYEVTMLGTDPTVYTNDVDSDNDGLTNLQEVTEGTHPYLPDSDFDGINDSSDTDPLQTDATSTSPINYNITVPVGLYDNTDTYEDDNGASCTKIYNKITGLTKSEQIGNKRTVTWYNQDGQVIALISFNGNEASCVTYTYNNKNIESITHNGFTYNFVYNVDNNLQTVKINNTTIVTNTYSEDNQLTSATLGNGYTNTYQYDANGNIISQSCNDVTRFQWVYDSNNNVTDYYDLSNNTHYTYTYDNDGTLTSFSDGSFLIAYSNMDNSYTTTYTDGLNVTTQTTNITYGEEDEDGFTPTTHTTSLITGDTLTAVSATKTTGSKTITSNNNTVLTESYTLDGDKVHFWQCPNKTLEYTYDQYDNITSIRENGNIAASYEYDLYGQLVRENDAKNSKTKVYTYDNGGNILSVTQYPYTTGTLGTATSTINYGYDANWKDLMTSYDGYTITYDTIGNPLNYHHGKTFTWNGRQLATMQKTGCTASYTYNSNGIRTSKTVNGVTTTYRLEGTKILSETTNNVTTQYIYDASDSIIGFMYSGQTYYFDKNAQGDIIRIYNISGTAICEYIYDAWGNFTATGNLTVAYANPFRYRGYYYDTESHLYYLQSRYYDNLTGRFLNADDVTSLKCHTSLLNLISYCNNNPINLSDENGFIPFFLYYGIGSLSNFQYNARIPVSGFLYNQMQKPACNFKFGFYKSNYNGCGWIATYNALYMLGRWMHPSEIIRRYEVRGNILAGTFGVDPHAIVLFFEQLRYRVSTQYNINYIDSSAKRNTTSILFYFNGPNVTYGAHYVAVKWNGREYLAYNLDSQCSNSQPTAIGSSLKQLIKWNNFNFKLLISLS